MGEVRWLDWVLGGSVAVLGACLAVVAARLDRLGRAVRGAGPASDAAWEAGLARLQADCQRTAEELAHLRAALARCVQRVGLVRYDAFEGSGGRLSFSLALLDARGDGVVVSVLTSRDGSYAYAKVVEGGVPSHPLSEEEQRAIARAMH